MNESRRRDFLLGSLGLGLGVLTPGGFPGGRLLARTREVSSSRLAVASFRLDVTPAPGHALCGGLVQPAREIDDRLEGIGLVISGASRPLVILALDWTGLLNSAHDRWREELARAAGTSRDRVMIHCVHQHDAPFACTDFDAIVREVPDLSPTVDPEFLADCRARSCEALREALGRLEPLVALGAGSARVKDVASIRRFRGPDGKILHWRGSRSSDPALRAMPEGPVDPRLDTLAFSTPRGRRICLHTYATHPMSHYGSGRVSSDFAGLARKRLAREDPGCEHLYLTGCAGDVACGKYNDGSPRARVELTEKLFAGLAASVESLERRRVGALEWRSLAFEPPPRTTGVPADLEAFVADPSHPRNRRIQRAYLLAWHRRRSRGEGPRLSALRLGDRIFLSLPGEVFVEYQHLARRLGGERGLHVAAYGDGGPWYLPPRSAYPAGGYEVSVAFCEPPGGDLLERGIRELLV